MNKLFSTLTISSHRFIRPFSTMVSSSKANVELTWSQLTLEPDATYGKSPLARSSHGVSFLENTNMLFVYGGEHVARTPLEEENQIYGWLADLKERKWIALASSELPPSRIAHAQAVHAPTQTVYLFGGRAGTAMQENAMNDLWAWNSSTQTWKEIATTGSPPEARSFHKMLCVGDALYVFGGCGQTSGRLADLHKLDLQTLEWTAMGASSLLKGRGGPNFVTLDQNKKLAVIAGFCGHETNDGHMYDLTTNKWDETTMTELDNLRPRSVCISASFPSSGVAVVFGGEVDPSKRAHEGAGNFANDLSLIDDSSGAFLESLPPTKESWPETRGWSDGSGWEDKTTGTGYLYVFGGLSGDDEKPVRLDDLWELKVTSTKA